MAANSPKTDANMPKTAAKPSDDPQEAARRRKMAKDRRRKQYDDLQVQGTNNSSIVSKRSVEMLYTSQLEPEMGEWFQHFVAKPKRRSPAINRGYWIRMEAIKQMILRIVALHPGKTVSVVNLGCGFDPLPFQLLKLFEKTDSNLHFYDFDYPELVQNKLSMIQNAVPILDLVGASEISEENSDHYKKLGVCFASKNYKLVGCDLKNVLLYRTQLQQLVGNTENSINIFVAEVSLAYMKPEYANPVIEVSSELKDTHFLILEQILPAGEHHAFAQKMLYHFSHLRSPLQCVQTYPQREDQIRRFERYFPSVEVANLLENWRFLVDEDTKKKVLQIEPFDEWEEFIVFCQHYVLVHATNTNKTVYRNCPGYGGDERLGKVRSNSEYSAVLGPNLQLQAKFAAAAPAKNGILIHGGLGQTRTNATVAFKDGKSDDLPVSGDVPSARMCHSLTALEDDRLLLMGGRARPGDDLAEVYELHNGLWRLSGHLSGPRSRHGAVSVGANEVLVFGGVGALESPFLVYNADRNECRSLTVTGAIPCLQSPLLVYDRSQNVGYIGGGMAEVHLPEISDKMYRFSLSLGKNGGVDGVKVELWAQNPGFARVGGQLALFPCSAGERARDLVFVGGVSDREVYNAENSILVVNADTGDVLAVAISADHWCRAPPTWIGFLLVEHDGRLVAIGGGAVCYSFGSTYNAVYEIVRGGSG